MATPQQFQRQPRDGVDALVTKVRKVQREASSTAKNLLRAAGLFVSETGLRVASALTVEGDLSSTGNTTIEGDTDIDGNTTIGGTLVVSADATFNGDLSVPNGSINNDALASPVTGAVASPGSASGFGFSTSFAAKASTSIAVPSGFTRAVVIATGGITGIDSAPNQIYARVSIGGSAGATLASLANLATSVPASHSRVMTGLSGGSISIEVQAHSGIAIAAGSGNLATVTGYAMFFRD